eukprot:Sspe_Gene.68283::Locus_40286_Transcript_1_1_Confidence_1.000_Length_1820::g.68283::m.68283
MASPNALAEAFDRILGFEDEHFNEGYQQGFHAASPAAVAEGVRKGTVAGEVIGSRIGYIQGFVAVLTPFAPHLGERPQRTLASCQAMLASISLDSPSSEAVEQVEAKFTTLCKQLGIKPRGVTTAAMMTAAGETVPATVDF